MAGAERHSQCVFQVLINFHDGSLVSAPIAVVGRAEDGNNIAILTPVVALHDQLMSSRDQGQAIVVIERF